MFRQNLGLVLIVGTLVVSALVAVLLVYVFKIDWFRHRLLSEDRWTRAQGMLPIVIPLYALAALIMSAMKRT